MNGTSHLAPMLSDRPSNRTSSTLRMILAGAALALPLTFSGALYAQSSPVEDAPIEEEVPAEDAVADEDEVAEDAAGGGYITESQVSTGNSAYQAQCASCHGNDMVASIARYPSAWLFYTFISQAMPANAPGSLPPQQYADIVAYLLSENGHPLGSEPLPPERDVLEAIDPDQPPAGAETDAGDEEGAEDDDSADDAEGNAGGADDEEADAGDAAQ